MPLRLQFLLLLVFSVPALLTFSSEDQPQHPGIHSTSNISEEVLYHYRGRLLRGSQWGKIAALQRATDQALERCDKPGIAVDGIYGPATHRGIQQLFECPGFANFRERESGLVVDRHLWHKLLPDVAPPTVRERAFALVLTHEGTDYERAQWNYGTSDSLSILTWGPFGATVGWGNEISGILSRLRQQEDSLLHRVFGDEYLIVDSLLANGDEAYELLRPVYENAQRREQWLEAFKTLGRTEQGRDAYDWYALESNRWLKPGLQRLYELIPEAKTKATEIDYAFFLDLALHASVARSRIHRAKHSLQAAREEAGQELTPAQRRRIIAEVFAEAVRRTFDRRGRNVVFYIDSLKSDDLTEQERTAWRQRTGLRASSFGLSDSRSYYPDFLNDNYY